MKVSFDVILKDRRGTDFFEVDPVKSAPGQPPVTKPVTLGDVVVAVLDQVFQDEATEGVKPKLRRGELIDRVTAAEDKGEPLELLDADRDMLKERIAKRGMPVMLTVAALRALDAEAQ
jgi:exoribonuclease II